MPYLPIDFDARKKYPPIAQGLGGSIAFVSHGFEEMWQGAWQSRRDVVNILQLECYFQAAGERVGRVLEAFGFLELLEDGQYRIRGCAEWLRIPTSKSENGSKGGKKTAASGKSLKNLKQNAISAEANASEPPKQDRSTTEANSEALTPSTQHPTPNIEETLAGDEPPPAKAKADPRMRPLTERLVAMYLELRGEKYRHSGAKDAQALKSLLPYGPEAIEQRWRAGLAGSGWKQVNTFAQLGAKWNDLAAPDTPVRSHLAATGTDDQFRREMAHFKTDENGDLILE